MAHITLNLMYFLFRYSNHFPLYYTLYIDSVTNTAVESGLYTALMRGMVYVAVPGILTQQSSINASFLAYTSFNISAVYTEFWYPSTQTKHIKPVHSHRGMTGVGIWGDRTIQLSKKLHFMMILGVEGWWIQGCIQAYFGTYWVYFDSI